MTSMHGSESRMQLWSGAQDGSMHAWDMRYKPSQPAVQLRQVCTLTVAPADSPADPSHATDIFHDVLSTRG